MGVVAIATFASLLAAIGAAGSIYRDEPVVLRTRVADRMAAWVLAVSLTGTVLGMIAMIVLKTS